MKKLISITLTIVLMFTMYFPSLAVGNKNPFIEYFKPFYTQDCSLYSIKGIDGSDITSKFFNETFEFYLSKNWEAIDNYFNQNVSEVSKINQNEQATALRSSELPKSTTISYIVLRDVENAGHPFFNNTKIRVFYSLTYELYYDEDTHRIVRALKPQLSNTSYEFVSLSEGFPDMFLEALLGCSLVSSNAIISSGQSSVAFSISFRVTLTTTIGGNYTSSYGVISNTYNMSI